MSKHITEAIATLAAIPHSEFEGTKLRDPEELLTDLVDEPTTGTDAKSEMIGELLVPSQLEVEWVAGEKGWSVGNFPDGAYEAMLDNLTEKQRQARKVYETTNERLPEFKEDIAIGLAEYGRRLGISDPELEELFASRIANIDEVKLEAPLAQGDVYGYILRNDSAVASLERKRGELRINVEALFAEAADTPLTADEIISRSLMHELEHGESVGATTPNGSWMVQSGLGVFPKLENGNRMWHGDLLLDEGAQEHIRWRNLDMVAPVYEKGVMFWEAIIAIDPNIERLRFEAKFLGRNRGELIGGIEAILGPHAVEELEGFWSKHLGILDYPAYKDKIVGMIDMYDPDQNERTAKTEAARKIARQKLDETQSEILAPRALDFTDDEMVRAKKLGATSASQVRGVLASVK